MTQTLLEIDPEAFAEAFGVRSTAVRHGLAGNPLLELEAIARLARLAQALPEQSIEHNLGDVPLVAGSDEVTTLDSDPAEIVRTIEANGSWMVLKNVEQRPEYAALLHGLLDEVRPLVGDREGGMLQREAFVFVSAPGAITPSHVDPEHNFLLQIRGTKTMNVGTFADPAIEQAELERIYGGGHRNIEQLPDTVEPYVLHAGDGVYVRPDAPHFVLNGDEVSVSLSITWRTASTKRTSRVHRANGRLRRLRLSPTPPGRRPGVDRVKAAAAVVDTAVGRVTKRAA
jgi:hypothetical protein